MLSLYPCGCEPKKAKTNGEYFAAGDNVIASPMESGGLSFCSSIDLSTNESSHVEIIVKRVHC